MASAVGQKWSRQRHPNASKERDPLSDIFREVEEDVRRERFEKLWKAYGSYAIAALVLLFAGIGGWQFWQRHELAEHQKVSDAFIAAQRISNPQTAASTFSDLARTAPKGYATVARLAQAGAMFTSGQRDGAIALYKQIAKDDNGTIGSVARLRAAWAMADTAPRGELADLLKPLDQPGSAWRENAREVLAYADYRAMDTKSALVKYSELATAPESPDGLRSRAKAMVAFLKNGGAVAYGSVPADVTPLPPQAANGQNPPQAGDASTPPGASPAPPAK
jgi:hypothetical protein